MNKQEKPNQDEATAIPAPDPAAIRSHVELLHTVAKSAGVEGILAFTRIDANNKTHTERFAIGDVDHMADAIIGWSTHPDLNIYASYATFRKDLPPGAAGGEADVRAVLAMVGDLDSDKGKKALGLDGLPVEPPYVVETSANNFHAVYPLGRALSPSDAKPIAVALSDAIGGDSGTKDVSHLWRIPGTLNWPSAKKLGRGRPKTPQLVTIKSAWTGETVDPGTLRQAATDFEFAKTSSGPSSTGSSSGSSSGSTGSSTGSSTETFDDLPADLKKLIAAPGYPGEDRSRTAASVIFKLFRRGWSDDAVQALFEAHPIGIGERYAGGPTGKTDLRKEIERLRQKFDENAFRDTDPVDLWAKFDPPTLPRGLLPAVIEAFAFDRGMTMGCDVAGIAVGALAVCAGAIPDDIKLQPKKNDTEWQEAARLWVLQIGDPSTMKTPMISAATKPLRRIDNEMAREWQEAMDEWLRLPKEEQKDTDKPKKLRAMIFDTTIESTQDILKDSPNGVLLEDDELSGWFDSMYKYSGARGAQKDRSFWLQAYNGGSKTVDRVTRGSVHIPNLSVSIIGGSQPGPIRKLADSGEDDGLLQRFIPIMVRPAVGGRDEAPGQAVFDYACLISDLRELKPPVGNLQRFDDGALKIREELERKHLELMQLEGLNRKLTSYFGKYNGIFARLCVVWHCVEHVGGDAGGELPDVIPEATAKRVANFLHGFLKQHAIAFYVGVLGLANDHDRLANVADYILAHRLERIINRDIQRGDRSMRGLKRHETESIFEQLEALGWVEKIPGSRPSDPPRWVVNPVVHQKFAARAERAKKRREQDRAMIGDLLKGGKA